MNAFNPAHFRAQFPALADAGVYLDSAATALKPLATIDASDQFYRLSAGNVHRSQFAAAQRFHNYNAKAFVRRVLQPGGSRLIFLIQIIVLNLAEGPIVSIDNFLKQTQPVMEGKPGMFDFAVLQRFI